MLGIRLEMLPSSESMKVSPYAGTAFADAAGWSTVVSASTEQPAAVSATSVSATSGRRGSLQRTASAYFVAAGGAAGAGAPGAAGAGGVRGADAGGASRTTDAERSPPRTASEN